MQVFKQFLIILMFSSTFISKASLVSAQSLPINSATKYYGTYSHAPQGSTRAMALGGAFTGLSDDASGLIYNPAGLNHGAWRFDFGSTFNNTINREADVNRDNTLDGVNFQFNFLAVAGKLGPLTIAIGKSSPFAAELYSRNSLFQRAGISISNTDYTLALLLTTKLSIGITQHNSELNENYLTYNNTSYKSVHFGKYITYGISYRAEKDMGYGLTYTPKMIIDVPDSLNQVSFNGNSTDLNWFRGIALPERYTFGGFFRGSSDLMYIADLDFIRPVENSVLVENPFDNQGVYNYEVKSKLVQIPHGGIEYTVYSHAKKAFIWRVGSYKEPARISGGKDRFHYTMGVELRIGALVMSASMDESTGFSNSSQSVNIVLGGI